jgi:hypothetical protein
MHPNALVIERLYAALSKHDAAAAAACYASNAEFEDIAFRLQGRKQIHEMWRMVCNREADVRVTDVHADFADDENGRGRWVAKYKLKGPFWPARCVTNNTVSEFVFSGEEIIRHDDRSDPLIWAKQAYPFPLGFLLGRIEPLRRLGAKLKLRKFLKEHPEGNVTGG